MHDTNWDRVLACKNLIQLSSFDFPVGNLTVLIGVSGDGGGKYVGYKKLLFHCHWSFARRVSSSSLKSNVLLLVLIM